jgi:hypothetical protein
LAGIIGGDKRSADGGELRGGSRVSDFAPSHLTKITAGAFLPKRLNEVAFSGDQIDRLRRLARATFFERPAAPGFFRDLLKVQRIFIRAEKQLRRVVAAEEELPLGSFGGADKSRDPAAIRFVAVIGIDQARIETVWIQNLVWFVWILGIIGQGLDSITGDTVIGLELQEARNQSGVPDCFRGSESRQAGQHGGSFDEEWTHKDFVVSGPDTAQLTLPTPRRHSSARRIARFLPRMCRVTQR